MLLQTIKDLKQTVETLAAADLETEVINEQLSQTCLVFMRTF